MKAQEVDELTAFQAFLTERLQTSGPKPSPEEAVDEWRELHPDPEMDEEEVAAIQEAIDDMNAGDKGRPADEVMAELRSKLGMPSK
jgi:hypothetical protein